MTNRLNGHPGFILLDKEVTSAEVRTGYLKKIMRHLAFRFYATGKFLILSLEKTSLVGT